ncbi:unnamed protein product [Colias eurytheme]|nr:unnamed protein product [Colias eurytheme]
MAGFENEEYADILYCYGLCDGDASAARREYAIRFPYRRLPNWSVFGATYRRLRESGRVQRCQSDAGRPRIYDPADEDEILSQLEADPTDSTRAVARRLNLSQWKVWFTLHTARQYPFHYTPVHAIEEGDPVRRMDFCRFLINCDIEDPEYFKRILWTDESKFDRDGISNYHNAHYWAPKGQNPRKSKETAHQIRFSLNVWMGIVHDCIVGPFFFPDNLNGVTYENFLRDELWALLEDVPLATRSRLIYQHDGCPAHYFRGVRQCLDEKYPHRWIGRGGPIPWPARCPDLTPCDFYIWGHMKQLVYNTPVTSPEELRERILTAAQNIKNTVSTRVTITEVRRRLRACIRNRGRQFEQDF